ncbi:hypothetical protein HII31_01358 [Pseudocercospora fuligena]|uniref:DUF7730 domain-containing protein n=1 Tax=Pseudocercospora fuligena TaxID=685502 RepID=A0A8H6VP00_9PEZI|nr:hypothetical protein HII31_01358 [Pseudocercospora fuligena]
MSDTNVGDDGPALAAALDAQARKTLKQEISNIVSPFRISQEEPPFTMGELIIMGIVMKECRFGNEEWCTSEEDIMLWIGDTFLYYAREMMSALVSGWAYQHHGFDDQQIYSGPPLYGFYDALHSHDLPVEGCTNKYIDWIAYQIVPHRARAYLSRWLCPPGEGSFRFLDLPPELRNRIYNNLFHFSGSTIDTYRSKLPKHEYEDPSYHQYRDKRRLKITELRHDAPDEQEFSNSRTRFSWVHPEEVSKLLSILVTCRQIHTEAKAIFYSNNVFAFDSISSLSHTLRYRLHSNRAQFLRHVQIDMGIFHRNGSDHIEDAFWRLASIPLDSLKLIESHCPAPVDSNRKSYCLRGKRHDQKLAKIGSKLDALVEACRNAKHVVFVPVQWTERDGEEHYCYALKRCVIGKLKQEGKEKMKCCSMMLPPKEREEMVD